MQYVRGYFWIGMIVLLWAAVLMGCASFDPRGAGRYSLTLATEETTGTLTVDAPAPFFVEPSYMVSAELITYNDNGSTTCARAFVSVGADSEEAKDFWGKAISGLIGFLAGLFA